MRGNPQTGLIRHETPSRRAKTIHPIRIKKSAVAVHIPRAMNALGDWRRFSREVIQTLKELRDRKDSIVGTVRKSPLFLPDFKVYGLRKDGDVWKCKVRPGYVIISNPSASSPPLKYIMPKIGEIELDSAEETPELEVSAGQTIYCKLPTNTDDQSTSGPLIVADEPEKEGTHYQPPPNAVSGEYWYRLADIIESETATGPNKPLVIKKQWFTGPLIHRPVITEAKSVGNAPLDPGSPAVPGDPEDPESVDIPAVPEEVDNNKGGTPVFKTRDNAGDALEFRSLKQLPGGGVSVIRKPNPEVPTPVDGEGNPVLDGEGNPIPGVPAEEEGDNILFHRFEVESGPPVSFENEANGNVNFLKFDGADGTLNVPGGGIITALKGIVTVITGGSGGWWGQVIFGFAGPGGSGDNSLVLNFEAGILVSVFNGYGGGGTEIPGTEGSPGTANFSASDT